MSQSLLMMLAGLAVAPAEGPVMTAAAEAPPAGAPDDVPAVLAPLAPVADALMDLGFRGGSLNPRVIIQYDAATYDQTAAGPPETDFRRGTIGDSGEALRARALEDGGFFRRLRVGVQGDRGRNFAYRADFELGGKDERGQARIAEVWLNYRRYAPLTIQAGAYPQPANAADAVRAASTLFLERPTAADLSRNLGAGDGRLGVTLRYSDEKYAVALSLTGPVIDHAETFAPRGAVVGRLSRVMHRSEDLSLHLEASATVVVAASEGDDEKVGFPIRFRNQPEVKVDTARLIDTGDIPASGARVVGLGGAAQRGSLYLLGEAFRFDVQREDNNNDPHFYGYYLEGSWVLTGERRRFDAANGSYWFPNPARPLGKGGWGAWEVAFRHSRMNLNYNAGAADQAPPPEGIRGGDQRVTGLALKWYPIQRINLTLNYLQVRVDRLNPASQAFPEPFGPAPATPPIGVQIGQTFGVWALHGRYAF